MRAPCSSRAVFLGAACAAALASLCAILMSRLATPPVYPLGTPLSAGRSPGGPPERQAPSPGIVASASKGRGPGRQEEGTDTEGAAGKGSDNTQGAEGTQGTEGTDREAVPAQEGSAVPANSRAAGDFVAAAPGPGGSEHPGTAPGSARLVAVGDLHGDLEHALGLLHHLGLVNASGHWIGGAATLVQTGDIVDRGPDSLTLLDLFWRLRGEAAAEKGSVVTLLGNHELMNLQGATHYVHSRELRQYGRRKWRADFAPSGEMGRRILQTHRLAAVAGEGQCRSLFVHAGLLPVFLSAWADVDALSAEGLAAIAMGLGDSEEEPEARQGAGKDALLRALLTTQGPLWYRGYAEDSEEEICGRVSEVLHWAGAHRMLIGHTPQRTIRTRCGGRLVLIDVGISRAYGGTPAAWECAASKTSVISL